MIPPSQLTGAVLAGGHSRRMGRDKAELPVDGEPLWRRQVAVLRAAGAGSVGIVRRPGQPLLPLPADVALWHDGLADIGPLAGVHAALAVCRTSWLAVVAVDLPRLDARWFCELAAACAPERGAIVRWSDGHFEPLAAIYPTAGLAEIAARGRGPDFSLQGLASALARQNLLAVVSRPDPERGRVANWNSPADVALSAANPASAPGS